MVSAHSGIERRGSDRLAGQTVYKKEEEGCMDLGYVYH